MSGKGLNYDQINYDHEDNRAKIDALLRHDPLPWYVTSWQAVPSVLMWAGIAFILLYVFIEIMR